MPFLNPALIKYLSGMAPDFDIVVPRTDDGLQPLHAVYSQKCLPFMKDLLNRDNLKILDLFHQGKIREVSTQEIRPLDPDLRAFLNINTPEDLESLSLSANSH